MDRRRRVEMKLEMEFGVAPDGDTLLPPRRNAAGLPRLLVSRFEGGSARFFRHDLPANLRATLDAEPIECLFSDEERVKSLLAGHAPCRQIYRVRWHTIERRPTPDEYPDVTLVDDRHAIVIDGAVASWARTDCESERAAEVSIETEPAYRGRGFARQVTASWAAATLTTGKVAFYSHLIDNAPSAAVAASLGLVHLCDEIEYF